MLRSLHSPKAALMPLEEDPMLKKIVLTTALIAGSVPAVA